MKHHLLQVLLELGDALLDDPSVHLDLGFTHTAAGGHTQLVYKHAVSTIMPAVPVSLFDEEETEAEAPAK